MTTALTSPYQGSRRMLVKSRAAKLIRMTNPANMSFRIKMIMRGKAVHSTIYIVPHNRNNVRLTIDAVKFLISQGVRCVFVHLDGLKRGGISRPELDKFGMEYIDYETLKSVIRPGDTLLTGNDYAPQFFRHFIDSISGGLVKVVGYIGGARLMRPHRFVRADYLLAMGPSVLSQRPQPTYLVGSPVIERYVRDQNFRRREGRYVLISFKGEWEDAAERASLEAAVAACERLCMPYMISVHPTMAARTNIPNSSSSDFGSLLPEAMALISRPSTTIYEALVCEIPVVLFPLVYPLVEFDEPHGAFRLTHDKDDLLNDIKEAVASRETYADRSRAFLAHNLSIDPDIPSWQRVATAMMDIHRMDNENGLSGRADKAPR